MVVQSSNVQATSQRSYLSVKSTSMLATRNLGIPPQEDTAEITAGKEKKPNNGLALGHLKPKNGNGQAPGHFKLKYKELKEDSLRYMAENSRPKIHRVRKPDQYGSKSPSSPEELRLRMLELMFEMITGSSRTSAVKSFNSENGSYSMSRQSESFSFSMSFLGGIFGISQDGAAGGAAAMREGWNIERFEYESEQVSYQARGIVNTADGRTLNVDISMYMSRQFVSYMNIGVEAEKRLYDPLVINYAGTVASLTGEKFSFDLTSDGNMESLASLGAGSGFLAVDKNGDGIINNGSELFGPDSGCGFSELREYDRDGNGWIDEADDIFDKLVIWSRDKDGNDTVYTLRELGIGAIYLGDIATEFTFKDETNETLGVMRSTSFFLKEDGGAGTVSHIDLIA